eukprot:gnl/TRDRNA2_/TRDRNA2_177988_c0_seq2.p1 gnl/TRDRNA2_/TRDRNA2_177988_c0~~gnl/TRDRNA2_/TRDRNA2_177988_c0_seq2.p1  ORF type:complete len:412 (+),score=-24.67 gnl/TRDRNA2_/TRDRNA2_177988_c0_seq2:36-1271(+)
MTESRKTLFLLYESVIGYAIFQHIPTNKNKRRKRGLEPDQTVKLVSFKAFTSKRVAIENVDAICNNKITDSLKSLIKKTAHYLITERNSTRETIKLAVNQIELGLEIEKTLGLNCVCNSTTSEIFKGIKSHFQRFIKGVSDYEIFKAQLCVAHTFLSIRFNLRKFDIIIIETMSLLDIIDKGVANFLLRIREWYGCHFPELNHIISNDDFEYLSVIMVLRDRCKVKEEIVEPLTRIVGEETKAREIFEMSKTSVGQDISPLDDINIAAFANRITLLIEYRQRLYHYITTNMHRIAPNLTSLVGAMAGARLLSHAGSLINLAKYSVSNQRILGSKKAFYKVLKSTNTAKHNHTINSSLFTPLKEKKRGRYLANKCSIAARIDAFMDETSTDSFGKKLKKELEEKLDLNYLSW